MRLIYGSIKMFILFAFFITGCAISQAPPVTYTDSLSGPNSDWQNNFDISTCTLLTEGSNEYFILEPGFQLVLEGGNEVLKITVLDETEMVDGIMTRVVEEREWKKETQRTFLHRPLSLLVNRLWFIVYGPTEGGV